jgi:integrase
MASCWLVTRTTKTGERRFRVEFRLGGREAPTRYGGSFRTKREALARKAWISGELAARRVPEIRFSEPARTLTLAEAYERWRASRVDVSAATATYQLSAIRRAKSLLDNRIDELTADDVAALVGELAGAGKSRETIRKTVTVLSMVLDFAGVLPNPARDRVRVRLPHEQRAEIQPPTAEHVLAVHEILPSRYRLPLLVLDATGMRLGELEGLRWGDVDEPRGRWRVSQAVSKTNQGRWVCRCRR